jgi:hypothetical protein
MKTRKKTTRRKATRKKRPAPKKLDLEDSICQICDELEELIFSLECMPGSSIHELESTIWEATGQAKTIQKLVEDLNRD